MKSLDGATSADLAEIEQIVKERMVSGKKISERKEIIFFFFFQN